MAAQTCHTFQPEGLVEEFEEELAEIHRRYGYQELLELLLVALEREQMVNVSYNDAWFLQRLERMGCGSDVEVQEVMLHALRWLWMDEQMHTIFVRGALLQLARMNKFRWLSLRVLASTIQGSIGGWSSAVYSHVPWRRGPLMRLVASIMIAVGSLSGKVPRAVRRYLDYGPFAHFCRFNVEVERTATIGWKRSVQVARGILDLPESWIGAFERIAQDEANHMQVFHIFDEAIDKNDCVRVGWSVERLARELASVGHHFVPKTYRATSLHVTDRMLGSGSEVHVIQGTAGCDTASGALSRALDAVHLSGIVAEISSVRAVALKDMTVVIKGFFTMCHDRNDPSNFVDPELLILLARRLSDIGCGKVIVLEAANLLDKFFLHRSVFELANYCGLLPRGQGLFEVRDAAEDQVPHDYTRGLGQQSISQCWKAADLRISFAKMCSHPVDMVFLTLANLEGLGARRDDFYFVDRMANRQAALMAIMEDFPPHLAFLDAYDSAADGLAGVMGCRRPLQPLRIYAGRDALAVDSVAARHMGLADPTSSETLRYAQHWFGKPLRPQVITGSNEPVIGWRGPLHNGWRAFLQLLAAPAHEHFSDRGAVFVPPMDPAAFPPSGALSCWLWFRRVAVQTILGLR